MLRHAAGEDDMLDLLQALVVNERRGDHELLGHWSIRPFLNGLEKYLRHVGAEVFFHFLSDLLAELDSVAKLMHHRAAAVFYPSNLIVFVESYQPGADVDGGGLGNHAVLYKG